MKKGWYLDEYKLTKHWAVDEDGIQKYEKWKRDDLRIIWNSQHTELLMKMIIRRVKNYWRMKDYLKLTEHWAPPLLPSTLQPTVTSVFISSSIFRTLWKTFWKCGHGRFCSLSFFNTPANSQFIIIWFSLVFGGSKLFFFGTYESFLRIF